MIRRLLVLNPKKRYTIAQVKAHPWLQNSGVATVNYEEERTKPKDEKDIDLDILGQLVVMGFEKEAAIKAILEGRYNQVSATYFLFKRKKIADLKLAKKNGDSNNSIDTKESTITTVKEDEELKTRPRGASISTPPSTEPPKSTDGPAAAPKPPVVTAPVARPRIQSAGAPRPAAVTVGHKHSPLANPGNVVDQEAGSTPEQAPKTTLLGEAPKATPQPAGIKSPPAAREKKLRPRAFSIGTATGGESTKNKPLEIKKVESRDDTSTTSGSTNFGSQALDADGIRTVRFAFNCSTTSSAPPTVMLEKIKEALETEKVKFNIELFLFSCVYYRDGDTTTTPINFEVEVCKIPRLAMHGIRFRRLSGEIWEYKRLCTRLIKDWESLKS